MSIPYHLWDKIFKKSYIADIEFPSKDNGEDIWFWYNTLLKSNRISIQRKCCYNHRTNLNSVPVNTEKIKKLFSALEKTYKLFNNDYKHLKPMFDMYVYSLIFNISDRKNSILLKDYEFKKYFIIK